MKLINTLNRSYNGTLQGQTVDITDKDQIADYLANGFEKAGKEDLTGMAPAGNVEKALDKMNKTELLAKATELELTIDPETTNPNIVIAIQAKQAELAAANAQ